MELLSWECSGGPLLLVHLSELSIRSEEAKGVFDEFLMICFSKGKGAVASSPGSLIIFPVPLAPSGVG